MLEFWLQKMFLLLAIAACSIVSAQPWPRWEERTLDCTSQGDDKCTLIAINRDPKDYPCRIEDMEHEPWNELARDSKLRIACPIACEPTPRLSVTVKSPPNNQLCQKYYTYGKYRDEEKGDWYLWMTEPCRTNLTTWCQFDDVYPHGEEKSNQVKLPEEIKS